VEWNKLSNDGRHEAGHRRETRHGDKAFFNKKKYIKELFNVITRAAEPANLDFAEKQRAPFFCVAAVNSGVPMLD
jgi:hypothetical protein